MQNGDLAQCSICLAIDARQNKNRGCKHLNNDMPAGTGCGAGKHSTCKGVFNKGTCVCICHDITDETIAATIESLKEMIKS